MKGWGRLPATDKPLGGRTEEARAAKLVNFLTSMVVLYHLLVLCQLFSGGFNILATNFGKDANFKGHFFNIRSKRELYNDKKEICSTFFRYCFPLRNHSCLIRKQSHFLGGVSPLSPPFFALCGVYKRLMTPGRQLRAPALLAQAPCFPP